MVSSLPTGEVTFMFTDIEGSTGLVQRLGPTWDTILADHNRLVRETITASRGVEVSTAGDAFFVVFADATSAVEAAVAIQRSLGAHAWADGLDLRVRAGIHTGDGRLLGDDYIGLDVHRASRICSAAWGGQVLVSGATVERARGRDVDFEDLGDHHLKDLAQPLRLYALVHPDLVSGLPAPRTLTTLPNNLPVRLTSFVGRDEDVDAVREAIRRSRLVTLVGAGGSGKTRLALAVAAEEAISHHDGTWFVDLSGLSDPALVPRAVAQVLEIRERVDAPVLDTLSAALGPRSLLIVLDNCEHVVESCAVLADRLVSSCPDVRVLATSREPLGVPGEVTWPVAPLAVPRDGGSASELERYPSTQLFCERARAAKPSFAVDERSAPLVARICRHLDGLPLAIELAAARTRALGLDELAARIEDRFRLLGGTSRTVADRQRTLEAAVDWSYALLDSSERTLFGRLSVFAGGFTLHDAERVCALEADLDVVDVLTRLVDKSLVVVEEHGGGTRYRLLETLRHYARDRLAERGETDVMRSKHLEWAAEMASTATDTGVGRRADEELDNLRAALEFAVEGGSVELGVRIVQMAQVGQLPEWHDWCRRVLADPTLDGEPRVRLLVRTAGIAFMMADWQASIDLHAEARLGLLELGDSAEAGIALMYEGLSLWGLGERERAGALLRDAVSELEGDALGPYSRALAALGQWEVERDLDLAETLSRKAEIIAREHDLAFELHHILENLARIAIKRSQSRDAAGALREALDIVVADRNDFCLAHVIETIGCWAVATERLDAAGELFGAAAALRAVTGDRPRPWDQQALPQARQAVLDVLGSQWAEEAEARGRELDRDAAVEHARRLLSA